MNPKYKKIYCCTPVAFHANDGFFIRDTGLIAKTLLNMGVESRCIMPLPYYEDDQTEHIIRTEYKNLKSVKWWKSLGIDALVLYSWGAPRYRKIAEAIKKAGIYLIIHMDTSGDFEGSARSTKPHISQIINRIKTSAQDFFRSIHLRRADVLTMAKPAADSISKRLFYGKWVCERLYPMPCPVSPRCTYDKRTKQPIILAIGRWDDSYQKRPDFLMKALSHFYACGGTAEVRILGTLTNDLTQWHSSLPPETASKIKLIGYIKNSALITEYCSAQVILCASSYESSHIVSAEALCCGCSVVTTHRPVELADLHWYTTQNSGTIATEDTPQSLASAIQKELNIWRMGLRNPVQIAAAWQPYFHVDKVFNNILK